MRGVAVSFETRTTVTGFPKRYWTGEQDITLGSESYKGSSTNDLTFTEMSPFQNDLEQSDTRFNTQFSIKDDALRGWIYQDNGQIRVTARYIYSDNGGQNWLDSGSLSDPQTCLLYTSPSPRD